MNIVITGGASGVGAALTRRLAQTGRHHIAFTFCSSVDAARSLEKEFSCTKAFHCDFADPESLKAFCAELSVLDPDVLVNNALRGMTMQHFHKMDTAQFLTGFQDNVLPVLKLTQEAIRIFRKKKFGKIITILTSYLLNRPPTGLSEYVAAKAYLASMSKSWAAENAAFNISSNCISPSFMKTKMTEATDERIIAEMESKSPARKLLDPTDVAAAVEFLLNATQHVNGTNLPINAASDVI